MHELSANYSLCVYCRIADPGASKPDDWDEDAPKEIVDEEAEKPEGWLDDEPEEIDDPGSFAVFTYLTSTIGYCHSTLGTLGILQLQGG